MQGKKFPWPRPPHCPGCGSRRLWGHGYVTRYFDGIDGSVWIKRWRCPDCTAVHTCRPDHFWRRFLAPIRFIIHCLYDKLEGKPWKKTVSRQRQQYWRHGCIRQSMFHGLPAGTIDALLEHRIIVATHSLIDRAMAVWPHPPHPRLAATGPPVKGDTGRTEDSHGQRTT